MKQLYQDFIAQAQSQVQEPLHRGRVVAAAVALAITTSQSLPSSEVGHPNEYFTNHVMPAAMATISAFNEAMVFDTHAALGYVRQLWQLRYWSAFQQNQAVKIVNGDFFGSYTGVNTVIADNFRVFLNENADVVANLSYFASDVIRAVAGNNAV
jgi:hypothetical protein